MPGVRRFTRPDTFELKVEIEKRVGMQKAETYFNLLTRFLSLKIRKHEFDKVCVGLIGRENVHLHNELLIGIVKNAAFLDIAPQKHVKANGTLPRTGLQSAFSPSPRKGRTPNIRERKYKDRPVHEKSRTDQEQQSATELLSLGSKPPLEINSVEDGEEVEQDSISHGVYSRSPVRAPLGISLHSNETRKVFSTGSDSGYKTETCHYSGHLPVASSLKNRLNHNLKMKGLDVTMDCVNLLNNGLDCFLKRVIKPSLELAHSRTSRRAGPLYSTSMLDFWVATKIDPKILGEFSHILDENC